MFPAKPSPPQDQQRDTGHWTLENIVIFIFISMINVDCYEISCEWKDLVSTLSESHSNHSTRLCHSVQQKCESEDFSFVQLDNHTDYKDILYLHVQTENVPEDDPVVQLDNHTDYKDT